MPTRSRLLRYVAVGVLNTAVTYAAYLLLRVLPYAAAYTLVFVAGSPLVYVL